MKLASIASTVGFASAVFLEPNEVVQGLSSVLPMIHKCDNNVTVSSDVEHFVYLLQDEKMPISQFPNIVAQLLEKIRQLLHMCSDGNSTLDMTDGNFAQDIYQYIKNNILKFDEQMLDEMEEMMKVCSFRAPDGKRCGQLLGQIMKHVFFGDHAPPALTLGSELERRSFSGGVMKGLLGNSKNFRDCAEDVAAIGHAGSSMIKDLLKRDVHAVIGDLAQLLHLLAGAVTRKHDLAAAFPLLPHPSLPAWFPHRSHECLAIEQSSGQRQVMVPDCMGTGCKANGVDHDCAWCVYDLDKCTAAYGATCRETIAARESQNAACVVPGNETDSTTLGPDMTSSKPDVTTTGASGPDVTTPEHAGPDSTTSPDDLIPTTSASPKDPDSPSPRPSPSPQPRPSPRPSPKPLPPLHGGACRAAIGELRPFLTIFKDGPLGVSKNLRSNLLEADEAMLKEMEDMGQYCTFRNANAGKCGESVGSISRLIFVGLEESAIMV